MNFIDAHSHVWTDDFAHYPLAPGKKPDPIDPAFTAEKLLTVCKPHGVTRVVLIQPSEYDTDNTYIIDMIKLYKGTFGGVAVLDMTKPVGEILATMKQQGVRGFRIMGHKSRPDVANWLDGKPYHEMFDVCASSGQSPCCLMDPEGLPALDRMLKQFPNTSVVIDHMCRIGADGNIREKEVDALCDMARHANVRIKISAFYAFGKKKAPYTDLLPMIQRLYGAYGSRRLMWASDCPYQVQNGHTYGASVELVSDRCKFLNSDDRDWVLSKTAEQVFF